MMNLRSFTETETYDDEPKKQLFVPIEDSTLPEAVFPWDIEQDNERWAWAVNYLYGCGFYKKGMWKKPKHIKTVDQLSKLLLWLRGPRNFILCFSPSPVYMRELYLYVAASWALTTGGRSEVCDVQDLIDAVFNRDSGRMESIEKSDLLLLPSTTEKDYVGLKSARGTILNMLLRRKTIGLPTVTDLYVTGKHKNVEPWYTRNAKRIKDIYGELAYDMFYGESAKYVYVAMPNKGVGG